jgi:hypothetical protein
MHRISRLRRWFGAALFFSGLMLLGGTKVDAYTTEHCIGGDLYIDFFSPSGEYQGFVRQRNAPQCLQNQYSG